MTSAPDRVPSLPGYEIDRVVGRGARGIVLAGSDPQGRPVAVKVVRPQADDVDVVQAQIESHVLDAVRHPHLVALRAVARTDDGRLALVSDLVDGAPLSRVVAGRGHLTTGEVVTVLTPLCGAVEALHAAAVTHGDVSPGNVLLTAEGRPLLADLGAAHLAGAGAGAVDGTPGFVAPEVLAGDRPGPAGDVYALGALGWFCLTGEVPEAAPFGMERTVVVGRLGAELGPAIAAALAPDPAVRPTAAELARLVWAGGPPHPLEVVVSGDAATALTHRLRLEAERALAAEAGGPDRRPAATRRPGRLRRIVPRRQGRGWAMAAGGVAVLLVAGAGLAWTAGLGSLPPPFPGRSAATVVHDPSASRRPPASTGGGETEGLSVLRDPRAPEEAARALLQELSTRRAGLLMTGDVTGLADVHEDGSESRDADEALLADLARSSARLVGVELTVREARLVERAGERVRVRARVATSAHEVVADGSTTARPARGGEPLDFVLVMTAAGWRISEVRESAAS